MWYRFVQLLFRVLFSIFFRLETIGRENIPHEGPSIAMMIFFNVIPLFKVQLLLFPLHSRRKKPPADYNRL